jgi:hypothetical protein
MNVIGGVAVERHLLLQQIAVRSVQRPFIIELAINGNGHLHVPETSIVALSDEFIVPFGSNRFSGT